MEMLVGVSPSFTKYVGFGFPTGQFGRRGTRVGRGSAGKALVMAMIRARGARRKVVVDTGKIMMLGWQSEEGRVEVFDGREKGLVSNVDQNLSFSFLFLFFFFWFRPWEVL